MRRALWIATALLVFMLSATAEKITVYLGVSSFTPASISGLAAWYDFSNASSITLNGSTISQINDLSGNSNTATQGTAANQPTQCAACQGSKNTATFASANSNFMAIANSASTQIGTNMTGWAVFAFVNWVDNAQNTVLEKGPHASGLNYLFGKTQNGLCSAGNCLKFTYNDGSFRDNYESSAFHGTNNQYYMIVWLVDRSGADTITFRVNGAQKGTAVACANACNYPSNNTTGARIGCNGSTAECLNGAIAEMGLYNSLLSAGQVSQLESYASGKWGLGF